ncbi:uncharacterized protein QC763_0103910 [Podospora pseudopauciseta]|uniref:Uncharacterized protein n=1 Tax=Podospora pseudopauciseta TaxID=2093780 RepID=A0ABR0H0Y1_9PEZI|nr:hypothetical protein QC763_0103910 [Podospora pseudopauciseta]
MHVPRNIQASGRLIYRDLSRPAQALKFGEWGLCNRAGWQHPAVARFVSIELHRRLISQPSQGSGIYILPYIQQIIQKHRLSYLSPFMVDLQVQH